MKKIIKTALSAMLAIAVGVLPTMAADGMDGSADADINKFRKFTPAIDGVVDAEYFSSYRVEHMWNTEPEYFGKYSADDGAFYGWDCKALSYLLWDDENIYVAIEIIDDDYGCIDAEHYGIIDSFGVSTKGPYLQDGALINLKYGDMGMTVFASRDGNVLFCPADPRISDDSGWCDVLTWYGDRGGEDGSYYAVTEVDGGYVIEACIRVKDDFRADLMHDGGTFSYGLSMVDSTSDSPYYSLGDMILTEDMSDGWWLADTVIIGEGFDLETNEMMLYSITLFDDKAVVLTLYDLTGDGTFDSKDLTRLMRVIAGDSAATVAQSADINEDGIVDVKDLTRMMKHLAGK